MGKKALARKFLDMRVKFNNGSERKRQKYIENNSNSYRSLSNNMIHKRTFLYYEHKYAFKVYQKTECLSKCAMGGSPTEVQPSPGCLLIKTLFPKKLLQFNITEVRGNQDSEVANWKFSVGLLVNNYNHETIKAKRFDKEEILWTFVLCSVLDLLC